MNLHKKIRNHITVHTITCHIPLSHNCGCVAFPMECYTDNAFGAV